MVDVLTLCNFCFFANALDFRTYTFEGLSETEKPSPRDLEQRSKWDYNSMSIVDREHFIYCRGLARNLIRWLHCNYDVAFNRSKKTIENFQTDFCGRYMLEQACAILNYKNKAEDEGLVGARLCTFEILDKQFGYLFPSHGVRWYGDWSAKREEFEEYTSLSFWDMDFTITQKTTPLPFKGIGYI